MSGRHALKTIDSQDLTFAGDYMPKQKGGKEQPSDSTTFSAKVEPDYPTGPPHGRERRRAPRRPLEVGVEVYGYDGDLTLIHAFGMTENVSRLGVLINVDEEIPVGSKAMVAVRPRHPALLPRLLRGKVVRCLGQEEGFGLAIHFDSDISQVAAPHVAALPPA